MVINNISQEYIVSLFYMVMNSMPIISNLAKVLDCSFKYWLYAQIVK